MSNLLRIVALGLMATLLILMIGPCQTIEARSGIWDKAAHFIAFGLMLWSLGVLFRRTPRLGLAATAVMIGVGVEIVQGMVGRDASLADIFADVLGVLAALLLWAVWRRFEPRAGLRLDGTQRLD